MIERKIQEHWNELNKDYSHVWESQAKQEMSKQELAFIARYLFFKKPDNALDIGVGNGRILDAVNRKTPISTAIYGIDIADKMVEICRRKFAREAKIKTLKVCNISKEDLRLGAVFDFVTAIRVLKYSANWQEIILKVHKAMKKDGIFIFTMPNSKSISGFHRDIFTKYRLPIQYSNKKQLISILNNAGFEILEIRGFSRLPDKLYYWSDNKIYVRLLLSGEKILEFFWGRSFLNRILFVVCKCK